MHATLVTITTQGCTHRSSVKCLVLLRQRSLHTTHTTSLYTSVTAITHSTIIANTHTYTRKYKTRVRRDMLWAL